MTMLRAKQHYFNPKYFGRFAPAQKMKFRYRKISTFLHSISINPLLHLSSH